MLPEDRTCCLCHAALSPLDGRESPVCGRQECRWAYRVIPRAHTCRVCRRPLTVADRAAGVCPTPRCRHTDHDRRAMDARERMAAADRALHFAGARRSAIPDPETYPITRLPAFRGKTSPLPKRRRQAFRSFLEQLLRECETAGWELPSPETAPVSELPAASSAARETVSGKACGGCRGYCCVAGGDHAWLTARTIRRYRREHPAAGPGEILAAYLALLGPRTYKGSCVYHGSNGCRLPREMRSDTCNRYFCPELRVFRARVPPAGPVRAFFVWPEPGDGLSGAFVDATTIRRVTNRERIDDGPSAGGD